jgi:uncharacterized protein (TIGR01777 family)
MKIVITGGTGQVGQILMRAFVADGHEVVILSRARGGLPVRTVVWDGCSPGLWRHELEGCDVVINLAGRSVNCRYHRRNRAEIMNSRVDSTRAIGTAIEQCESPPRVWLQASTATIYSHRFDAPNNEISGNIGGTEHGVPDTWKFSIDVARAWEEAAQSFTLSVTRLVLLRSAMTMSPDSGGIFDTLLNLVRHGLGGTCGNGRQFVSWIHEFDFVAAVRWLIEHALDGPVNVTSPHPVPNAEFMRTLRRAWGTSVGFRANRWMLELGAILMRTETELILKSRRVVPTRLLEAGFQFQYPHWSAAAAELCQRWRDSQIEQRFARQVHSSVKSTIKSAATCSRANRSDSTASP